MIYITILYTFIQTNIEGTMFAVAFVITTLIFLLATVWFVRKVIKKPDYRDGKQ
ncbi:hypothetical protein [Gracilibacillus xinjiangensis]|uniref:Uncharacterized protein n=1 Tax=Gracilibacillus xinjiangensis TaxID=1193282 RepID=A0ABV8WSI8_9BACI